MKTKRFIGLVAAVLLLLVSSVALAQPWKGYRGSGGWGIGSPYNRTYNPATVEILAGTVEAVEQIRPMQGMQGGIHLSVKTDKETVSVHLGPSWYIERMDTKIEKGDKVEVKGSRVSLSGKPAIIANEVKKGDNILVLRDSAGIPVWAGWRR